MDWIVIIALAVLAGFFVWASADVASGVYLNCLCRKKTAQPVVALTFDDGPDESMTPKVLDVLKAHGVHATFFLIGTQAERLPQIVRRIAAEGHTIGNHTHTHAAAFPFYPVGRIREELRRTRHTIEQIIGKRMRLFRPPFGVTDPTIGRAVRSEGLQGIGWSIRSLDTIGRTPRQAVSRKVIAALHPGAVILLHDRCPDADRLLEEILTGIEANGYQTQTIDQLFNIDAYEN